MGIVFIGVFTLAALGIIYRGNRLRRGKAVPMAFSSFLLAFQLFQMLSHIATHSFFFNTVEHFVLSSLILGATLHQLSNSRSMQYIWTEIYQKKGPLRAFFCWCNSAFQSPNITQSAYKNILNIEVARHETKSSHREYLGRNLLQLPNQIKTVLLIWLMLQFPHVANLTAIQASFRNLNFLKTILHSLCGQLQLLCRNCSLFTAGPCTQYQYNPNPCDSIYNDSFTLFHS